MMSHAHAEHSARHFSARVVDWGAVWSGALVGAGAMTMVSALWLALGFGSGVDTFHADIEWWLAGTGIGSVLIGGFVAGATSRSGGTGRGTTNSVVMWALLAIPAAFVTLIVAAANHATASSATGVLERVGNGSLWAAWWSMLIGLGAAVVGGMAGGAVRDAVTPDTEVAQHEPIEAWAYPPTAAGDSQPAAGRRSPIRR
jgi:hypothetical protein